MADELFTLFTGNPDDTWPQTLTRFQRFLQTDVDDDLDEETGERFVLNFGREYDLANLFQQDAPMSEQELDGYEARYGVAIPADLRTFLINEGRCTFYPAGRLPPFHFFQSDHPLLPNLKALPDAISYYGASHFLEHELSSEQIAQLSDRFFCFAVNHLSDSDHAFLIFDRQGGFGFYSFISEDYPFSKKGLEHLLAQAKLPYCLDEVLRRSVNWAVYIMLIRHDVPDHPCWKLHWSTHMPGQAHWSL